MANEWPAKPGSVGGLVGGAAVLLLVGIGGWYVTRQTSDAGGIRVVPGHVAAARVVPADLPVRSSVLAVKAPATEPLVTAKSYGEPAIALDPLLDRALAGAPEEIGVRQRQFAMQWPVARDGSAERGWRQRLSSLAGDQADRVRIRCSTTTCEIGTDDPATAPRLAGLTAPTGDDHVGPCPLIAADAARPGWMQGTMAVVYVARSPC